MKPELPHICLIAHNSYGAISGGVSGHIGGVERQTALTARWLSTKGYPVSMLTWNESTPDDETIDGVRIIKICRQWAGLPGVRFVHPRWTGLLSALRRADADVYYHNCAEYVTGQAGRWCRKNNRTFVYSVANNPDVDPKLPMMPSWRERILYREGLRCADRIIVQTKHQQDMLKQAFGYESVILPMPCPGPADDAYQPMDPPTNNSRHILWIGRVCESKRPDRLVELAKRCPEYHFDLVGPIGDDDYSQSIKQLAAPVSNVTICGSVEYGRTVEYYRNAACLCCTSDVEGFPNTFLEAWSHGLPMATMFDPDRIVQREKLGVSAATLEELEVGMQQLLKSPNEWLQASANARQHYAEHYLPEAVLPRFEKIFVETWQANQ